MRFLKVMYNMQKNMYYMRFLKVMYNMRKNMYYMRFLKVMYNMKCFRILYMTFCYAEKPHIVHDFFLYCYCTKTYAQCIVVERKCVYKY